MGFPRQGYWSGLPFPIPGDLLDPKIKPTFSALAGGFFTTETPRKLPSGDTLMLKQKTQESLRVTDIPLKT